MTPEYVYTFMAGAIGLFVGMMIDMIVQGNRVEKLEKELEEYRKQPEIIEIKDNRIPDTDYFKKF